MIDLHASHFDPAFRRRDYNQFMHPTLPDELVELPGSAPRLIRLYPTPETRFDVATWLPA